MEEISTKRKRQPAARTRPTAAERANISLAREHGVTFGIAWAANYADDAELQRVAALAGENFTGRAHHDWEAVRKAAPSLDDLVANLPAASEDAANERASYGAAPLLEGFLVGVSMLLKIASEAE